MSENTILWIVGGLVSLVNFLFWSRIKRIEKDLDEEKKKSSLIEKNYLSRFEQLHSKLSEVEKNIIREIYNLKLAVSSRRRYKKGQLYLFFSVLLLYLQEYGINTLLQLDRNKVLYNT